jgi:hypothetical protein
MPTTPPPTFPRQGSYAIASKGVIYSHEAVVNYLTYVVPLVIVFFVMIVATMMQLTGDLQGYVVGGETIALVLIAFILYLVFAFWRRRVTHCPSLQVLYDLANDEFIITDGKRESRLKAGDIRIVKAKRNRWFCPLWALFWLKEKDLGHLVFECTIDGKKKTIEVRNITTPSVAKARAEMMLEHYHRKEEARKAAEEAARQAAEAQEEKEAKSE